MSHADGANTLFLDVKTARNIVHSAEVVSLWQVHPFILSHKYPAPDIGTVGSFFNIFGMARNIAGN